MKTIRMGKIVNENRCISIIDSDIDSSIEWVVVEYNSEKILISKNNILHSVSWIDLLRNKLIFGETIVTLNGDEYIISSPNKDIYSLCDNNKDEWSYLNDYDEKYFHKVQLKNNSKEGSCFLWEDTKLIGYRPILRKVM
jgi:hypothetical protein